MQLIEAIQQNVSVFSGMKYSLHPSPDPGAGGLYAPFFVWPASDGLLPLGQAQGTAQSAPPTRTEAFRGAWGSVTGVALFLTHFKNRGVLVSIGSLCHLIALRPFVPGSGVQGAPLLYFSCVLRRACTSIPQPGAGPFLTGSSPEPSDPSLPAVWPAARSPLLQPGSSASSRHGGGAGWPP